MDADKRKKKHRSSRHRDDDDDRDHKKSSSSKRKHSKKHHRDDDGGDKDGEEQRKRKKHRRERDEERGNSSDGERRHRSSKSSKKQRSRKERDDEDRDRKEKRSSSTRKESKKKDHHKKDKKKKKDRNSSRSSKGKDKTKKKHIPSEDQLTPLGDRPGKPPSTLLDPEKDYFSYHQHLWVYLYRKEGVAFNDLTSDESHEAFARFVKLYNAGDLEAAYYDPKGLPAAALEECKTTEHSWTFNTSEREDKSLRALQEGVRKQTEYDATGSGGGGGGGGGGAIATKSQSAPDSSAAQQKGDDSAGRNSSRRLAEDRSKDRVANRRLKEHVRTVEGELSGGRKEGRERQIEKRKEQAARIHGAAREREAGGVELDDSALYGGEGGGEVDFRAAMAREKKRSSDREDKRKKHIADLQQKEKDKQQEMLKKLGLSGIKPGEKIKIAPRKD